MNTQLFNSSNNRGKTIPVADAVNEAGGLAYRHTQEHELAQLAATGCFGNTFYSTPEDQLKRVLELAGKCSAEFVAKCAAYSRSQGLMKDMPAVLCAVLASRPDGKPYLNLVWNTCIDNVKQLRNFVQVIRSGVTGRKSFGSSIRNMIRKWLAGKTPVQLFYQSLGTNPTIGDIIKMVHPKPDSDTRAMTYAYLMGKEVAAAGILPQEIQNYLAFRADQTKPMPKINFQFLASLPLTKDHWTELCLSSSWQTLRMNLNTFQRHGVFENASVVKKVIARLTDEDEIRKAKPMPYQLYSAYVHAQDLPPGIVQALAKAADLSLKNIPDLPDNLVIGVDTSGSMSSAITGNRAATSKITCVQVASLFAAALVAKCPTAKVIPFDTKYHPGFKIGGSIVDTATALSKFGGGGTACSIPLQQAAQMSAVDAVIIISDNESWHDRHNGGRGTQSMQYWREIKTKNPKAKLVCIDLTPSTTAQVVNDKDTANVGGFSDAVFSFLAQFLKGGKSWVDVVNNVNLQKLTGSTVVVAQGSDEDS